MSINWMRRAGLLAASLTLAVLAGCGSGTIEKPLTPARLISFGTAFSDLGQNGAKYTVNDGSVNTWVEEFAAQYGTTIKTSPAGGNSYARGNARVIQTPDAAFNASTPTIKAQIDAFLAKDAFGPSDMVLVEGGISDIIFQMNATLSGAQTQNQMNTNIAQAGTDFGAQVRRLVQAGAKYIVLTGAYNLGRTPWATAIAQTSNLNNAMILFNQALLVSIVDLGGNVLYIDSAYYYNLVTGAPTSYALTDATSVVCNSVDPTNGIGLGPNQVNSFLCNQNTIVPPLVYTSYFFADQVYPTPSAHRLFGDYAFTRVRARW